MDVNDVVINLKAQIDAKETRKEFEKIAQNSRTAVERSFKNLELTMRKTMQNINMGVSKQGLGIDADPYVEDMRNKVQELYEQIRNTGNLPMGMTSQILDATQNLDALINKYYQLLNVLGETQDAFTRDKEAEIAKSNQEIADIQKAIDFYQKKAAEAQDLQTKYAGFQSLAQNFSITRGGKTMTGESALKDYEDRKKKIEETKAKILELQNAVSQGLIPANKVQDANTEITRLEKSLRMLLAIQGQINGKTAEYLLGMRQAVANSATFQKLKDAFSSTDVFGALKSEGADARQTVAALTSGLDREEQKLKEINATTLEQSTDFQRINQAVDETAVNIVKAAARVNELEEKSKKAGMSFSQWRNVVWSVSRLLGSMYTVSLDVVRGAKMIANFYKTVYGYVKQVLGVFKKLRDHIRKTTKDHAKSWKQMLRDIFRYAFGIRSLFALFRRLRRYIREAFEEMAKQIPEVNKVLSELKSSLGMLKGSLATAFEPIVSAIAPALNLLIEKLAQAMTYLGMFFAAFTGRGYVYKANKVVQSFADSVKEMNKQLQGFDELNNLTTNNSGGNADTPLAEFEKVDVPDWIKNIADYIKELWGQIMAPIREAWSKIGEYVKTAWSRAFYSLKALGIDVVESFVQAWSEKGEGITSRILEIVGDIGNTVANISDALRIAWEYEDNGYRIWSAVLDIIDKILEGVRKITLDITLWTRDINLTPAMTAFADWLESLAPVAEMVMDILYDLWNDAIKPILTWTFDGENSGVARFFQILKDFNDKLDKDKIRTDLDKIWEALGRFGQTVGEGLLEFMERISDKVANWVNSDKFTEFCDKVAEFLDNIEPGDIADRLEQILRIIGNILEFLWEAIQYVKDFNYQGKDILDWIEYLSEHLDTIAKLAVFGKLAIDVIRFGANVALLVGALSKLPPLGATIVSAFSKVKNFFSTTFGAVTLIITGAIMAVKNFIKMFQDGWDIVSSILEAIGIALAAIGVFLLTSIPGAIVALVAFIVWGVSQIVILVHEHWDAIVAIFKKIGESIKTKVTEIVTAVITKFTELKTKAVEIFTGIVNTISEKITNFKTNISNALNFIKNNWDNIWTAMKNSVINIFSSMWSNIKGTINSILSGVERMANGIVSGINKVIQSLNNLQIDIPDWIPEYGGRRVGFSIPYINQISLPRLAQGAVIPPNKEFMAVLGDQKSGTNVEAPLDTIKQAVAEVMTQMSVTSQDTGDIVINIDGKEVFRVVRKQAQIYRKSTGLNPI